MSVARVSAALDAIEDALSVSGTYPKKFPDLYSLFPEYADALDDLKHNSSSYYGMTPVRYLRQRGILRTAVSMARAAEASTPRKEGRAGAAKPCSLREAKLDDLIGEYLASGMPSVIVSGDAGSAWLPDTVAGVDFKRRLQLVTERIGVPIRDAASCKALAGLKPGTPLSARVQHVRGVTKLALTTPDGCRIADEGYEVFGGHPALDAGDEVYLSGFFGERRPDGFIASSPIAAYEGCTLRAVCADAKKIGDSFIQVELSAVGELTGSVARYILLVCGLASRDDLAPGVAWCARFAAPQSARSDYRRLRAQFERDALNRPPVALRDGPLVEEREVDKAIRHLIAEGWYEEELVLPVRGTGYLGRANRVGHVQVGDPLLVASDWDTHFFDSVALEVFNAEGETLGFVSREFVSSVDCRPRIRDAVVALLLPFVRATAVSVTPRGKNKRHAFMDVRLEIDPACSDTRQLLAFAGRLWALPPRARALVSKGTLEVSDLRGSIEPEGALTRRAVRETLDSILGQSL